LIVFSFLFFFFLNSHSLFNCATSQDNWKTFSTAMFHDLEHKFARVATEGLSALAPTIVRTRSDIHGVAVVLTRGGQLFGLSLNDGSIAWSRVRPSDASGMMLAGATADGGKLFEIRRPGIFAARMVAAIQSDVRTHEFPNSFFKKLLSSL
jgi:hypothetical protein